MPPMPPGMPPGGAPQGSPQGGPPQAQGGPPSPGPKPPVPYQGPYSGFPDQNSIPPQIYDKILGMERIARSIKLLRNEKLLGFRVSIEVESNIYADKNQDRQDRTAFIGAVTQYLQQAAMITMQMPQAAPFLGKLLQFAVRSFPVGRELEQAIEDFVDEAEIAAKQHAANPQPNPQMLKAQADMLKAQATSQGQQLKMQTDQQKAQAEVERQAIENQGELQNAQQDTQQKAI